VVTVKPPEKGMMCSGSFSYRYLFYGLDFPLQLSLTPHRPIDISMLQGLLTHTQTNYGKQSAAKIPKGRRGLSAGGVHSAYILIPRQRVLKQCVLMCEFYHSGPAEGLTPFLPEF